MQCERSVWCEKLADENDKETAGIHLRRSAAHASFMVQGGSGPHTHTRRVGNAANRSLGMENPGPSSAPLISDDPSQRYQRGLNTLKDTQRMVR